MSETVTVVGVHLLQQVVGGDATTVDKYADVEVSISEVDVVTLVDSPDGCNEVEIVPCIFFFVCVFGTVSNDGWFLSRSYSVDMVMLGLLVAAIDAVPRSIPHVDVEVQWVLNDAGRRRLSTFSNACCSSARVLKG